MSWHADAAVFESECAQHPGFLTVFRNAAPNNPNNPNNSNNNNNNKQQQLDYENFRHVCYKWHTKLLKCFVVCLKSEEYLQMRNSLIILTKIASLFPRLVSFGATLERQVEKIKQVEKEKRQDIFTLASAYLGQLKMRRAQMLDESKFHIIISTISPPPPPSVSITKNATATINTAPNENRSLAHRAAGASSLKTPLTSKLSSSVVSAAARQTTVPTKTTTSSSKENSVTVAATKVNGSMHKSR
jgi:THO complex subunit 2